MEKQGKSRFTAYALRRDTVKYLQDLKEVFELVHGRQFTNDGFIRQVVASVEAGDPGVWEVFCQMQEDRRRLEELARSRRDDLKVADGLESR